MNTSLSSNWKNKKTKNKQKTLSVLSESGKVLCTLCVVLMSSFGQMYFVRLVLKSAVRVQ